MLLDFFPGNRLLLHQKDLEIFKKKEAPILTKEEMEENVRTIEQIMQILQEDEKEAKVNGLCVNCNLIALPSTCSNLGHCLHVVQGAGDCCMCVPI
jgi:hypothetical protein